MKKVLYGRSGVGKSAEIIRFINEHDNLLIASPFSMEEQMRGFQKTSIDLQVADEDTVPGIPEKDIFRVPLHGGIWHGIYLPLYMLPKAMFFEKFQYQMSTDKECKDIVNNSANTLILWGGFEGYLMQREFVQWLTDLPCSVLIEFTTSSVDKDQDLDCFQEVNDNPESKNSWVLVDIADMASYLQTGKSG